MMERLEDCSKENAIALADEFEALGYFTPLEREEVLPYRVNA